MALAYSRSALRKERWVWLAFHKVNIVERLKSQPDPAWIKNDEASKAVLSRHTGRRSRTSMYFATQQHPVAVLTIAASHIHVLSRHTGRPDHKKAPRCGAKGGESGQGLYAAATATSGIAEL